MSESTHPTPWYRHDDGHLCDADGERIVMDDAFLARIVAAVNAHEAMVKALTDNCATEPGEMPEQPDERTFAELLSHLATILENKRLLAHMAKPTTKSGEAWALLLRRKFAQISALALAEGK